MLRLPSSQHLVTSFHCDLSHPQSLQIFNANFLTSFSGSGQCCGINIVTQGFVTFGLHFVIFLSLGPQKSSISLLANEQVGPVHLFKLQLDRLFPETPVFEYPMNSRQNVQYPFLKTT
jgi:hypothetical protein